MVCLICSLLRKLDFCLLIQYVSTTEDRALCREEFRDGNPELLYLSLLPLKTMALSSSPIKTQKQIGISLPPLKINECNRKGPLVFANRRALFLQGMG